MSAPDPTAGLQSIGDRNSSATSIASSGLRVRLGPKTDQPTNQLSAGTAIKAWTLLGQAIRRKVDHETWKLRQEALPPRGNPHQPTKHKVGNTNKDYSQPTANACTNTHAQVSFAGWEAGRVLGIATLQLTKPNLRQQSQGTSDSSSTNMQSTYGRRVHKTSIEQTRIEPPPINWGSNFNSHGENNRHNSTGYVRHDKN
jgi:hypothetical protein